MLEFDYTNVLDSAVGERGIPKNAFEKATKSTHLLVDALESARTGGRLGFADLPFDEKPAKAVVTFARNHAFPNVLVLGIGGSALGPLALDAALARPNTGKRLIALDNIDPDFIRDTLDTIAPEDTIVNIIAKLPRKRWRHSPLCASG
jgi:glucose-6-phosphate isomerase